MTANDAADKVPSLDFCLGSIRQFVLVAVGQVLTFHDFEQALLPLVLQAGAAAVAEFLRLQGCGDLGPSITLPAEPPLPAATVPPQPAATAQPQPAATDTSPQAIPAYPRLSRRLDQLHQRDLTCVFGTFSLERTCYGSRDGQRIDFVPLDNRLDLPKAKPSYLLQDFNALLATEQPFEQSGLVLRRILGLKQSIDSLERQGQHMAGHVEPFRSSQEAPATAEEGPILVRTADAKGVPMRCAADAPPIKSHQHKTGRKPGRKKQAIVGSVDSVEPLVRRPEQIVEMLFRDPKADKPEQKKRPEPCHKRVMARLNEYTDKQGVKHDGKTEVFAWMRRELEERNPHRDKTIVNIFDGDLRLQKAKKKHEVSAGRQDAQQGQTKPGKQVSVLDLLHVTSRLWKAARLVGEADEKAREEQVREWLLGVLRGKVEAVLADMREKGQQKELKGAGKKELEKLCNYLYKRRKHMRYHSYLKKGYPIASGVIEGACRHYVKDRMERTGMSWKQPGAQAMLELRSQALNGDWLPFQAFYRGRQSKLLYPHRALLDAVAWPLAV